MVSLKDLENNAKYLNKTMQSLGSKARIKISRRYNYHAIDVYPVGNVNSQWGTLVTGLSKKQAYDYINVMEKGINLATGSKYRKLPSWAKK